MFYLRRYLHTYEFNDEGIYDLLYIMSLAFGRDVVCVYLWCFLYLGTDYTMDFKLHRNRGYYDNFTHEILTSLASTKIMYVES